MEQARGIEGKTALIIMNMQRDYCNNCSPEEYAKKRKITYSIISLLNKAREKDCPVIFVKEIHRDPALFENEMIAHRVNDRPIQGTAGSEIVENLLPLKKNEYVIEKTRFSCFRGTELGYLLKVNRVETLLVCGLHTEVSIHYSMIDAYQQGFQVYAITDCISGFSDETSERVVEHLQSINPDFFKPLNVALKALDSFDE